MKWLSLGGVAFAALVLVVLVRPSVLVVSSGDLTAGVKEDGVKEDPEGLENQ